MSHPDPSREYGENEIGSPRNAALRAKIAGKNKKPHSMPQDPGTVKANSPAASHVLAAAHKRFESIKGHRSKK